MAIRTLIQRPVPKARADVSLAIVNIVLLLIFFFLVTGQLLNAPNFSVVLSETSELPIESLPRPLLIVNDDGSLSLDGDPVAPNLLGPALAGQPVVHLLITKTAPATDLITLLALPGLAATEVKLVTINRADSGQ